MNRRAFIKLLSASAMVPVIGLPAVAPGAPAEVAPVFSWIGGTYSGKAHYVYLSVTYTFAKQLNQRGEHDKSNNTP